MEKEQTELVVLGGGPGGYASAFYAAERGMDVVLVDVEEKLGGTCLLRGCIPSKAYLHATQTMGEARKSADRGIIFDEPRVDIAKLREWKEGVVDQLSQGVSGLAKQREVRVMLGRGYFEDSATLRIENEADGQRYLGFEHAIIATGSRAVLPEVFDLGHPNIMTSAEALDLPDIPQRLLVIGGGYIGLELGTVYARLGSKVSLVEALEGLMPGTDPDLVKPVENAARELFENIRVNTKVTEMKTSGKQLKAVITGEDGEEREEYFDRVLVAVGRRPNSGNLGLDNTKAGVDDDGFIETGDDCDTDDPAIYAIGDVAGGVLLAHKASREARIAVNSLLGELTTSQDLLVPSVVFTEPEMAWVGLTEPEAREQGRKYSVARFPWKSSGRALSYGHPEGVTKMLLDPDTERVLGVSIVGHGAGELISEGAFAMEMGATALDLAETIHPHPTLSETLMECAEAFYGTATHSLSGRERQGEDEDEERG